MPGIVHHPKSHIDLAFNSSTLTTPLLSTATNTILIFYGGTQYLHHFRHHARVGIAGTMSRPCSPYSLQTWSRNIIGVHVWGDHACRDGRLLPVTPKRPHLNHIQILSQRECVNLCWRVISLSTSSPSLSHISYFGKCCLPHQ